MRVRRASVLRHSTRARSATVLGLRAKVTGTATDYFFASSVTVEGSRKAVTARHRRADTGW